MTMSCVKVTHNSFELCAHLFIKSKLIFEACSNLTKRAVNKRFRVYLFKRPANIVTEDKIFILIKNCWLEQDKSFCHVNIVLYLFCLFLLTFVGYESIGNIICYTWIVY